MLTKYFFPGKSILSFFIVLCPTSCQKEERYGCSQNVASLSGTYKLTALKYKASSSSAEQDYLVFLDACERDDLIILNANGTYLNQDEGVTCSPNSNDSGTWGLNGNIITSDGIMNGTIESFDCSTLIFYLTDLSVPGDRMSFIMVKQ